MLATPSWTPFPKTQYQRPTFRTTIISSSKFQRRRHRPSPRSNDYLEEEEEYGSMGRIVLTSLKSTPSRRIEPVQIQPDKNSHSRNKKKKEAEEAAKEERQTTSLSGSDVLWALQRATKERIRSKSKGKKKVMKKRIEGEDEGKIDYGNVKDFNVKSDWGDRLNELESCLQELERF